MDLPLLETLAVTRFTRTPPRLFLARSGAGDVFVAPADADRALEAEVRAGMAAELLPPWIEHELHYVFPPAFDHVHDHRLLRSGTEEGDAFLAALPPSNQFAGWTHPVPGHIDAPWCIALDGDGGLAAIAETARLGPRGAECGVTTAPSLRGRGFAAAATAGWATHPTLAGLVLFYSAFVANLSSHRVADRLRLRRFAASWTAR